MNIEAVRHMAASEGTSWKEAQEGLTEAEEAMNEVLDACDLSPAFLSGYNEANGRVVVTEASLAHEPSEARLFELNGEEV
jgi:hypothetical protein